MGANAFGAAYFGQYAMGVATPGVVVLLDPVYTGHIAYGTQGAVDEGELGEISDTVGGVVEEEVTV